jgi:protein-tyrosine kinase
MSRIDEALRRISQGPAQRGPSRVTDPSSRRADEMPIEQYPRESNATPDQAGPTSDRRSPVATYREARNIAPAVHEGGRSRLHLDARAAARLVVGKDRDPLSLEQYRRLAATLHDAQVERGLKTVMITSTVPREGKTLTAINLALTLSESYKRRVLLIDADLRRPSIHEVLGIQNETGLSEVLRDSAVQLPLVQVSPLLTVLTSGQLESSPQAVLSSNRLRTLLEEGGTHFDWVLLDTPPVGLLSDAQILSRLAQAVVFVVRAGSTPHALVEKAIGEVGRDCIIGTVLNGVDRQSMPVQTYYGHYYDRD